MQECKGCNKIFDYELETYNGEPFCEECLEKIKEAEYEREREQPKKSKISEPDFDI